MFTNTPVNELKEQFHFLWATCNSFHTFICYENLKKKKPPIAGMYKE